MEDGKKTALPRSRLGERMAVSDTRADVRMDGVYFFRSCVSYPFNKSLDPGDFSYCLMVRRGNLRLLSDFPEPHGIDLGPGAIVGVSGLTPHCLQSPTGGAEIVANPFDRKAMHQRDGGESDVELIIGVAPSENIALSNLMLGPVYLDRDTSPQCARRIWKAAELLDEELIGAEEEYGQAIIVRRIAEIILINMTRSILYEKGARGVHDTNVVRNRGIPRAVRAFLDAPLEEWNVSKLARAAGMSRTKFAEEFRNLMGRTPMQTVGRIRLTLVARKLLTEEISIDEAADIAGYSSAAAFIRAFRREFGATPLQWRKGRLTGADQ